MDYKYIDQLIDRYFDGQTSLEEEKILRAFFNQEELPEQYAQYAPLFEYEQQAATLGLSSDFDERMEAAIAKETQALRPKITLRQRIAPFFKAAATVAIILTVGTAAERAISQEEAEDQNPTAVESTYVRAEQVDAILQPNKPAPAATASAQKTDTIVPPIFFGEQTATE